MLSFKAHYISSPTVRQQGLSRKKRKHVVSFVELDPYSSSDKLSISSAASSWGKIESNGYGYDISRNMSRVGGCARVSQGERFYALTSQLYDFEKLIPEKILAMMQVINYDDDTQFIEYLQVDPKNSKKSKQPLFRHVGSAMLNSLKALFSDKSIILDSDNDVISFYLKNGFKDLGANSSNEHRMFFKRVTKSLH